MLCAGIMVRGTSSLHYGSVMFRVSVSAILFSLALSGCGLFSTPAERAVQKSPNFRAGYSDGCAAASTTGANYRAGAYRDEALFKTSAAYRAGWGNGFSVCRRDGSGATPGSPLDSSLLNQSPGAH